MRIPPDSFQTQGLRKKMIAGLEEKGIKSTKVLKIMEKIPRHFFYFDEIFIEKAYQDIAFQIGEGQTISAPYTVALQTSLLDIQKNDKVLEIGAGSGYQTAILEGLGAEVFSIERQEYLHQKTKRLFDFLQLKSKLLYSDGFEGYSSMAPFDKILLTCAAPVLPEQLLTQLKIGGKMVLPLEEGKNQILVYLFRASEKIFRYKKMGDCRFVPMLEKTMATFL